MREHCVNLCELRWFEGGDFPGEALVELVKNIAREASFESCDRVYVGSSFCAASFAHSTGRRALNALACACDVLEVPCTLTVPAATEGELDAVKQSLEDALALCPAIDEVTVNDYGMLEWMANRSARPLNIGRLFSRDLRDPRYEGGFADCYRPAIVPEALQALMDEYAQVRGVEIDPAGWAVDLSGVPALARAAVHVPYLFATTGKHCSVAPARKKGLPASSGDACAQECCASMVTHGLFKARPDAGCDGSEASAEAPDLYYLKRGKTVYVLNEGVRIGGAESYRVVYTPRHFGWLLEGESA